jgi:hypothetical protein
MYSQNQRIMKKNMGMADRVIRVVIALVLITLFALNIISGTIGIILIALSAVFILTSLFGFCPLYMPLKITSSSKKE